MDKKELKFYEAPAQEVMELQLQGVLCGSTNAKNVDVEPLEED